MIKMKKASMHIEIILSFIIFVSFLIFILSIFPITMTEKSKIGLDIAERMVLNNTKSDVFYFTVVLNETQKKCFWVNNSNVGTAIVKNEAGGSVIFINENNAGEKKVFINDLTGRFYGIYSSPDFVDPGNSFNTNPCSDLSKKGEAVDYGTTRIINALSYEKLMNLNASYYLDYAALRTSFSMPKKDNFGFMVKDSRGNVMIRAIKSRADKIEVMARETPVQIFYNNGSSVFLMLNVQSW